MVNHHGLSRFRILINFCWCAIEHRNLIYHLWQGLNSMFKPLARYYKMLNSFKKQHIGTTSWAEITANDAADRGNHSKTWFCWKWCRGFLKWGYPQSSSISRRDFPQKKPSILGYPPWLWKPPCFMVFHFPDRTSTRHGDSKGTGGSLIGKSYHWTEKWMAGWYDEFYEQIYPIIFSWLSLLIYPN